jgi:hypothetical protein
MTFEISQRSMRLVIVNMSQLVKMRKRMQIHRTDMGITYGTVMDKMRHFNEFFRLLRFCVLDLCFFLYWNTTL